MMFLSAVSRTARAHEEQIWPLILARVFNPDLSKDVLESESEGFG
jgi:hypothetical protein